MLRFLEPAFSDAGVTARLVPSAPVFANCDPALVEQILLNLLKNAIEALAPGNGAGVEARAGGRGVHRHLRRRPGLDPEAEAHLFRPFSTTKGAAGNRAGAWR